MCKGEKLLHTFIGLNFVLNISLLGIVYLYVYDIHVVTLIDCDPHVGRLDKCPNICKTIQLPHMHIQP